MTKHLVTGGSGFLGNLIASKLLMQGEEVSILDIWQDEKQDKNIKFIQSDIRDKDNVIKAMKGIDVVHHNAALVPLTKSGTRFWSVNVEGSRAAAESALTAGVTKFIHMSSSAIFGIPQEYPITASTLPKPVEVYGKSKLAGELAVREVFRGSNVLLSVIRPRTILGEGRLGIFQILFEWIHHNRDVYTIGKGNGLFQFVHAHDLLDAYMKTLRLEKSGVYNIGTDNFASLNSALENLIGYAGSNSRIRHLPEKLTIGTLKILDKARLSPLAPWHYKTFHKPFYFDMQPLVDIGWKAKYSNDLMLQESYEWFLKHKKINNSSGNSPHRKNVNEKILKFLRIIS